MNFRFLWIFLLTCCYFKVSPIKVQAFHPCKELSRVKQIAQYLIYRAGGSARIAGEMVGMKVKGSQYSIKTIQGLIDIGDYETKKDIDNLTILTKAT